MPAELVLHTLRHVWQTLQPLKTPVALVGGIAMAAWKYVRATKDIDLLLAIAESSVGGVMAALSAANIRPKRTPPVMNLGQLDVIQLLYEPPEALMDVQIDLLLAKLPYHRAALQRRVFTQLPDLDVEVAVLTCEDLILHKLLAGRIIDRADAAALLRANRTSLDLNYLVQWTERLELGSPLAEVWTDAFPHESLPPAITD